MPKNTQAEKLRSSRQRLSSAVPVKWLEHRLQALCHAEKEREYDQHQIADYQVCRQSQLPVAAAHNGGVVHESYYTDGELHDEGGEAERADVPDRGNGRAGKGEVQLAAPEYEVRQEDQYAEDGAQGRGQGRAADAQVERVHEEPVEGYVGAGADSQGDHGQLGPRFIAHQAAQKEGEYLERRKGDDVAHVLCGLAVDVLRGAEQDGQAVYEQVSENDYDYSQPHGADKSRVEDIHGPFLLAAAQVSGYEHAGARRQWPIERAMSISMSGTLTAAAAMESVPSRWPINTPSTIT